MEILRDLQKEQDDILSHLSGGCYTIVGSPIDLKVCYSYNSKDKSVTVKVTLAGETMGRATLSASKPSVDFSLSLVVVKASIELKFEVSDLSLKYSAKACYYAPFSWHCASHHGTIVKF